MRHLSRRAIGTTSLTLVLLVFVRIGFAQQKAPTESATTHYSQGAIRLHLVDDDITVDEELIDRWVGTAARAVSEYYGRYPVERVDIFVSSTDEGTISGGTAYGARRIVISLGPATTERNLRRDWRMTHEMLHLAFPDLDDRHLWLNEGVSSYIEPIARVRINNMTEADHWKWLAEGLPNGLPKRGDRGLDRTHTWGRTYWGGALFCFLADLRIRQETDNRKSIEDALEAILQAGGNGDVTWPIEKVLHTGDAATGTTVLTDLYAEMATKPMDVDLPDLWRKLGVEYDRRTRQVRLDNNAPWSDLRRAMTIAPAK